MEEVKSETPCVEQEDEVRKRQLEEEETLKQTLVTYINELKERFDRRIAARQININPKRPEESYFSKLDSNIKKNTAFVRKVKNFTAAQLDGLFNDLKVLNLTKYITELAAALAEAKLKAVDIVPASTFCCAVHRLYSDFENAYLESCKKNLSIKTDEPVNAPKYRTDLKLFAELVLCGMWAMPPPSKGLQLLGSILVSLVHNDKEDHNNISHILSFCRSYGEEYAGLTPREMIEASKKFNIEIPLCSVIPTEKHKSVRALFLEYYDSFCKHLIKNHNHLQKFEKQSRNILQTKGELSANRKTEYNDLLSEYHKLVDNARQFSEILNIDMPSLAIEEIGKAEDIVIDDMLLSTDEKQVASIWEDEETQGFYETLPDLHVFLPNLARSESQQQQQQQPVSEVTEEVLDNEVEILDEEVTEEKKPEEVEPETTENTGNKFLFSVFINHLPTCCNRDTVDNMAIEFVLNLNTKNNRKKLARCLFGVNRTRIDLLPFYSRLVTIIFPVAPDVSNDLCHMLKQDFLYHIRKKDQINIETKIKVVRFIGELVKFKMYSKLEGLYCIKILLQEFNHHHIEMLCNLLETCGRFLYNQPDCHQRIKVYLEQMMRKKSVMALDSRYQTMVENAFFAVIPREGGQTVRKERPAMHEFIRYIVYQELCKQNANVIIKLLHKVDWSDANISSYVVKCLVSAWNVKYFNIRTLAGLVADLSRYQDNIQTEVIDGVLEDIRLGLEVMLPKYNQRRIAMIKYLGELYYYHMVDSNDVLSVLYLLITFGVTLDYNNPSTLDPPGHVFRLRLVCVLLETCGQYFSSGSARRKIDYFLVFFQNYFWFKFSDPCWTTDSPFPARLKHLVRDCLTTVRPKMVIFHSLEESQEAVDELRQHFGSKIINETKPVIGDLNCIEEQNENNDESVEDVEVEDGEDDVDEDEDDEEDRTFDGSNPPSQSQGEDLPILAEEDANSTPHGLQKVDCQEDEDFMSAFDKLVADQIHERVKERVTPQQIDISVPFHIRVSTKKTYDQLMKPAEETSTVNFVLMMRKGNKHTYKSLNVPVTSELAVNLKEQETVARMEKERVKRLTLDINERLEEEDYQDMMTQSQRPVVSNLNRERKQKYHHPRGVPDVDLIFGTSKGK